MDNLLGTILWQQFGAAIDMLDNALVACPDARWREAVWRDASLPVENVEFWYVAYHTLFWLDLYLYGGSEGFAPPPPFTLSELDPSGALPDRTYSREELRAYLASLRQRCRATLETITDERARQPAGLGWKRAGAAITYAELQLYSMRHVQEHTAQLSLTLGHNGVSGEQIRWVAYAKVDPR